MSKYELISKFLNFFLKFKFIVRKVVRKIKENPKFIREILSFCVCVCVLAVMCC